MTNWVVSYTPRYCDFFFLRNNPCTLRKNSSSLLPVLIFPRLPLTNLYDFAIYDLFTILDLFASTAIPYHIAIVDLFAILDLFARASLPEFFIAFALGPQIFTSSQSLISSHELTSSQSLLCNSSSLCRNINYLYLQIFTILELFAMLDLFARTCLFAILELFARTAFRNSLVLCNP